MVPPGKEDRVLSVMKRWVEGEITIDQADRELALHGVKHPKEMEEYRGNPKD